MVSKTLLRACACGVSLSIGGFGAHAGLVEIHTSESFGQVTDWTHTYQLPQFDDQGGTRTLLSVSVTLDATIDAMGSAENLEAWDTQISLSLDASVSLTFLDESLVAPTGIHKEEMFLASAFDGDIDFEGPSGDSFDLSGAAEASTDRGGGDDLTPWIGGGLVDILGTGVSISSATGPGNVVFDFRTQAFGQVTIRYEYVPTPGSWAIMIAAMPMIMARRRRRRE